MSNDGATRAVARFIRETTYPSIPEPVRESARRTIADTVAVFLAGSGGDVVPRVAGQLLGTEDNQSHDRENQQLERADVHAAESSPATGPANRSRPVSHRSSR